MKAISLGVSCAAAAMAYLACVVGQVSEDGKPCGCDEALGFWCSNPFQPDAGACQSLRCGVPGQANCGGVACTDLASDPANCGACGQACPGDPYGVVTCVDGGCGVQCGYETHASNAGCVEYTQNYGPGPCGSGGETCAEGLFCFYASTAGYEGVCHCVPDAGTCGPTGTCVTKPTDQHGYFRCGECTAGLKRACVYGEKCNAEGECSCNGGAPCLDAESACCNSGCKQLGSDIENCGVCGYRCPSGFACHAPSDVTVVAVGTNYCVCTADTPCQLANVPDGSAACDEDAGLCSCFGSLCGPGQLCTNAGCR